MRKRIRILGREASAWAQQGKLIFLGPKRTAREPRGGRVVAFVHGWGAAGAVFEPLRRHVEHVLAVPTIDFTYRSTWSFAEVTERLARVLDRLGDGGAEIDLVGHSLGGLVARWYVQEMEGAPHVRRVVTLATPHAGTASARLAPGPLRSVLLPNSAVVHRLAAGRDRASAIDHTALVAGADLMVTPPASAAALRDAQVIWFDELGHNAMLFDRGVHEAVVRALSRPTKSDPADSASSGNEADSSAT
jgi:triacylglycerol esterase/lipase EstA (alpha/beta hydrolase family)